MKEIYILDCISDSKYREKFIKGLSIQNERRRVSLKNIIRLINNNNCFYAKFFEDGTNFGFCIAQTSEWDSNVIGKKCLLINYFYSVNYLAAKFILDDLFKSIPKDTFLITYDNNLSPIFQDIAFEEIGFHIGSHYYDWEGSSDKINQFFLSFHKRFNLSVLDSNHVNDINTLVNYYPPPGRITEDPHVKPYAGKLYFEWVFNSIEDVNKEVIGYIIDNKVQGLITYNLPLEGSSKLGVLCLNDKLNIGIIGYALISYACYKIINNGCKNIYIGTSKYNNPINNIYANNGFELKNSGLFFHWVNGQH